MYYVDRSSVTDGESDTCIKSDFEFKSLDYEDDVVMYPSGHNALVECTQETSNKDAKFWEPGFSSPIGGENCLKKVLLINKISAKCRIEDRFGTKKKRGCWTSLRRSHALLRSRAAKWMKKS